MKRYFFINLLLNVKQEWLIENLWFGYNEITANKYWSYYLSRTFYICIVHFVPNVCAVKSFEEYYVMFTCSYTFMTLIHYFNYYFMYASLFSYV